MTALDMARLGWLWCNLGRWGDTQIVPAPWLHESVKVNPTSARTPGEQGAKYGQGFWSNELDRCWPGLPRDSFAAIGAGSQLIWCCPSLDLVIVEGPGYFETAEPETPTLAALATSVC